MLGSCFIGRSAILYKEAPILTDRGLRMMAPRVGAPERGSVG